MSEPFATIKSISDHTISNKRVLLRVDFNVTLTNRGKIADDERIMQALPTIQLLLKNKNKLIIVSHLDRPKKRDPKFSLKVVTARLQSLLPNYKVTLVDDFLSQEGQEQIREQKEKQVLLLENIRFYEGEQKNDRTFAKKLADLCDVFVNDAFGVCHRSDASVVGIPKFKPSYAGLLLEKETEAIGKILHNAKKPMTAIIGGAKISTKLAFLSKLAQVADNLLLGGGIANTFLLAKGLEIGNSLAERSEVDKAKTVLRNAKKTHTHIVLPVDVVGTFNGPKSREKVVKSDAIPTGFSVYDIGPETQAMFSSIIHRSQTIVWNGPVGYSEEEKFSRGTDFLYYSLTHGGHPFSLVGGGDTIAAISKKEYLNKITHISTGGGAMLEFIEKGTLPGLEALKHTA